MDSALAQTFESIEFLIVDDCGTDSSISIVKELQETHPRGKDIHILYQKENKGVSAARNRIIDEAQGRYLYFMDADDLIESETLSILMSHQRRTGADIVYGSYDKIETYHDHRILETIQYPYLELNGKVSWLNMLGVNIGEYRPPFGIMWLMWRFSVKRIYGLLTPVSGKIWHLVLN